MHEGEDAKEKGNEGKSRGFGFVNFEEHESAVKAIEAFNGTVSSSGVYCVCVLVMLSIVFSAKYRLKILEGIMVFLAKALAQAWVCRLACFVNVHDI